MRRVFLGLVILGTMLIGVPAQATLGTPTTFTVGPATPCAVVCAYWDVPTAAGFDACTNPFPEGSYVDLTVTAPLGANLLAVEIFPEVDWDLFICAANNGVVLAQGAQGHFDRCDSTLLGPVTSVPTACYEKAVTPVVPGTDYVLRFYNWSDVAPLLGQYTFFQV